MNVQGMSPLGRYERALRAREMRGFRGFGDFLEDERLSRTGYKTETGTVMSPVASLSFYPDGTTVAVGQQAADYTSAFKMWKWTALIGIPVALVAGGIVAKKVL